MSSAAMACGLLQEVGELACLVINVVNDNVSCGR